MLIGSVLARAERRRAELMVVIGQGDCSAVWWRPSVVVALTGGYKLRLHGGSKAVGHGYATPCPTAFDDRPAYAG